MKVLAWWQKKGIGDRETGIKREVRGKRPDIGHSLQGLERWLNIERTWF